MEKANDRYAPIYLGVDTHSETHVAVALDGAGRRLGDIPVSNTVAGVEGTGSYGAALFRFLRARGVRVVEVNRTSRQHRSRHGKHDAGDAEAAARQALVGTASGEPKGADGAAEPLRPGSPCAPWRSVARRHPRPLRGDRRTRRSDRAAG